MAVIDSHQHFWNLARGDYSWPNDSVAPIFRDVMPDDLAPLLASAGVTQTVLVQVTPTVAETEFLLGIAATTPFVAGVVGWVDLGAPDAIAAIDRLRQDPMLKGLRPMLQSIDDTDRILRPDLAPALAHMEAADLRFDALGQPRHLPVIAELARRHPGLGIVIDHIAKPRMGAGIAPDPAWLAGMSALASLPNVWCKLSGMVTEIGPDWRQADLADHAGHVLAAFGPGRVMWGSDWPVVTLAAGYDDWLASARALTAGLNASDRDQVFDGTARAFYGLAPA